MYIFWLSSLGHTCCIVTLASNPPPIWLPSTSLQVNGGETQVVVRVASKCLVVTVVITTRKFCRLGYRGHMY